MDENKFVVRLRFGSIAGGDWNYTDACPHDAFTFDTEAEKLAFTRGIDAGYGWSEVTDVKDTK